VLDLLLIGFIRVQLVQKAAAPCDVLVVNHRNGIETFAPALALWHRTHDGSDKYYRLQSLHRPFVFVTKSY
jgi:hypothetical protein